jgi:uncharacterized DUF497 family protein
LVRKGAVLYYDFEWDPNKERNNLRRRQLSFRRAATVFHDPNQLTLYDETHSEQEERWITLGLDSGGILLVVVHTFEQVSDEVYRIRIISARKAESPEMMQYQERNR